MLLGDMIERLEDEASAMETLIGIGDLALLSRVRDAATMQALAPGEFASRAVSLFSSQASDEDWVSLIGVMGRTTDPGGTCLKQMLEFALRPPKAPHGCGHA